MGLLFLGLQAPALSSEGPKKVAVLPFAMHAERDLTFLREGLLDMLASRLYWKDKVSVISKGVVKQAMGDHKGPIDMGYALGVGRELDADYVLFGSLTVFGDSVSVDATMANVKEKEPPVTAFVQTKGMESVIPEINKFAQKVNAKIFGRGYEDAEFAYVPKDRGPVKGMERVSPLNPQFRRYHQVDVEGLSYWKSKRFKAEITGMDLGDVDGDGRNELVLLEGMNVVVYRFRDGVLDRMAGYESSDHTRFLAVDVADMNGNGRAEIFASKVTETSVTSVVLELEGNRLKPVVKNFPWFFRVMSWPGRGKILVGQQKMPGSTGGSAGLISSYFDQEIYALTWDGKTYVKAEEAPLISMRSLYVYNFAIGDLSGDGAPEIVRIDQNNKLRILDMQGEELFRTTEHYGGTINYLVTNPDVANTRHGSLKRTQLYIPARILIADLDHNGKNEIIVNQNHSMTYGLAERFRAFSNGKMVSLTWTGVSLDPNWESRKLSGCLSDYNIKDLDHNGKPDLVVALLQKRGTSFFREARSMVVSYHLSEPENK